MRRSPRPPRDVERDSSPCLLPPAWLCEEELNPVWQLNKQLLDALMTNNGSASAALSSNFQPNIAHSLRSLGDVGRQRLAQVPCLLVDGGFRNTQQWLDAKDALPEGLLTGSECGWSRSPTGRHLARTTLHLAWYWARSHRQAVSLVLDASSPCATVISKLDLLVLGRLAEAYADWFRPRWVDRPRVWRSLIALAQNEPSSPLFSADISGLNLLFGEIVAEPT